MLHIFCFQIGPLGFGASLNLFMIECLFLLLVCVQFSCCGLANTTHDFAESTFTQQTGQVYPTVCCANETSPSCDGTTIVPNLIHPEVPVQYGQSFLQLSFCHFEGCAVQVFERKSLQLYSICST